MDYLLTALKVIVGLSILNVWLVQYNKDTRWRGGDASTIFGEFKAYGLPEWSVYVVGVIKIALAIMLIASIRYPTLEVVAALGLAAMLTGSVMMHLKISDPLIKSFPAALFLVMSLVVAYFGYY